MKDFRTVTRGLLGGILMLGSIQGVASCNAVEGEPHDSAGSSDGLEVVGFRGVSSGDVQYERIVAQWNRSMCLGVAGTNSTTNGTNIALWQCDQVTETWNLDADGKLRAGWDSTMCLDVSGTNSTTNGTNIGLWQCDQVTETWNLTTDGYLQAAWAPTLCIDVAGLHSVNNGTNIGLWSCAQSGETWDFRTSTGWIDRDNPGGAGNHDWEKLVQHTNGGQIPDSMVGIEPAYVEARLIATGEDLSSTGDTKTLKTIYGVKVKSEASNLAEGDYEVQFHYGWTPWINWDTAPSTGVGDYEGHWRYTDWSYGGGVAPGDPSLAGRMPPRDPTRTECRLVSDPDTVYSSDDPTDADGYLWATWSGDAVKFRCDNAYGYKCRNDDQAAGVSCSEDVEVRHYFGYQELCRGNHSDGWDNGLCDSLADHGELCTADDACQPDLVCDLAGLTCANCTSIPQNGCNFDSQYCEQDECHEKKFVGESCAFDDQCDSGICDLFTCVECTALPQEGCDFNNQYCEAGACHDKKVNGESCTLSDQCDSGICDLFTCVECTALPQNGCDFGNQYCEFSECHDKKPNGQGCVLGDQCESGICDFQTCVECTAVPQNGCDFDTQYCELANCHDYKQVMESCTIEMDDQCISDECKGMGPAATDYRCSDNCNNDSDCNGGICDTNGWCNTIECGGLSASQNCGSGAYCDNTDNQCYNKKGLGQSCLFPNQCQSGVCDLIAGCIECAGNSDCGSNEYCEFTNCHSKKGSGQGCAWNDQCLSGTCFFFTCT